MVYPIEVWVETRWDPSPQKDTRNCLEVKCDANALPTLKRKQKYNMLEMEQLRPGLISINGVSCFLNAVVQCICTVFKLAGSVPSIEHNSNEKVEELYRLCSQMQVTPLRRITKPTTLPNFEKKTNNLILLAAAVS